MGRRSDSRCLYLPLLIWLKTPFRAATRPARNIASVASVKRVLGTVGLIVAGASQPTLGEVVDRDYRATAEHLEDKDADWAWTVPMARPVDMSDFVPRPVTVTVTSAGNLHPSGRSAGPAAVLVQERGEVGEMFHLTEIELSLLTEAVAFTGTFTLTSEIPCSGRMSVDRRRLTITNSSRGRRVPWTVLVAGLELATKREVKAGTNMRLEIAIRSPQRLTRHRLAGSPGILRE